MSKQLESITIYATLRGDIWMPHVECTKETVNRFTPDGSTAYSRKWNGLEEALTFITNDGDFRDCKIDWNCMVIRWLLNGKYWLEQEVEIPHCKLTKDYLI